MISYVTKWLVDDVFLVVWLTLDHCRYRSKLIQYKLLLDMVTDNLYNKLTSYQFCSSPSVL